MAEDGSAIDALDALLTEEGVPPAAAASGATPGEMSGDSQKLKNYADLMKKVPLLRSLTEEEQLKIAALLKPKEFEDGENIIKQGEEGDCMYFIQSGEAEAVVDGVGVVMEYGFGGFFGELALRTSAPRAATVRAKGFSSTVLELPRSAFEWLMKQKGDIKALIEEQASSYAGAGSFDVEVSATPKGNAALNEEQLRELADSQGLEITLLKAENVELMKDLEEMKRQLAASQSEVESLKAGGVVAAEAGDDDMDGET